MSDILHRSLTPNSLKTSSSDEKISEAFEKGIHSSKKGNGSAGLTKEEKKLTGSIVAQGPEAEILAKRYANTLSRHSRLNPNNNPSILSRLILVIFVIILFWYAIQSRLKVIEWKRSLHTEPYDEDYADWNNLSPMADDSGIPVNIDYRHVEL